MKEIEKNRIWSKKDIKKAKVKGKKMSKYLKSGKNVRKQNRL